MKKQQKKKWKQQLQEWIETQYGTAGWEMKLENFIQSLLDKQIEQAKAQERERIIEFVQVNQKGQFEEDAGCICWYLDDLIKAIKEDK